MFNCMKLCCYKSAEVVDNSIEIDRIINNQEAKQENKYNTIKKIGEGGTSQVFKIQNIKTGKFYTCKKLRKSKFHRAYREVQILKKIKTPLFPRFIKYYVEDDKINIVTDYIDGIELFHVIDSQLNDTTLKQDDFIKYIKCMAECIKTLHDLGFVHLDIKFENFLLVSNNPLQLKLIDLGSAHQIQTKLTKLSITSGTRGYSPSEIYRGLYNDKSDVWSLGVCFWIILAKSAPFNHKDVKRTNKNDSNFPFHMFYFPTAHHLFYKTSSNKKQFDLIVKMLTPLPKSRISIQKVLTSKALVV